MKYKVKYYELKINDSYETYLKTPEAVYKALQDDYSPIQEVMVIYGLNIKNKIILKKQVAIGSYNTIMCSPADIFQYLLLAGCRSFIIAHNHPSNELTPSQEDIVFTKKLEKACKYVGVNMLDHIIFTNKEYYSFKKNRLIWAKIHGGKEWLY